MSSRRGPRRWRPGSCTRTRATTTPIYGNDPIDAAYAPIARKGVESSARLGRHHWVVERTVSWVAGCRRLHRRYERKPEHFLAFVGIAVTLICHRPLTKCNNV
ncbi:transposase [Streptomyces sp. TE33382]